MTLSTHLTNSEASAGSSSSPPALIDAILRRHPSVGAVLVVVRPDGTQTFESRGWAKAESGVKRAVSPPFSRLQPPAAGPVDLPNTLTSSVLGGRALYGRHGIAGEWGHSHLDDSGGTCYCGRTGCVETVLSGPALERFYRQRSGRQCSLDEIDVRAREGDPHARETVDRLLDYLAIGLGRVVNIVDPAAIVIGGGVGNLDRIYSDLPERLAAQVFTPCFSAPILRPELGDSAGVFGAACLWRDDGEGAPSPHGKR